MTPLVAEVVRSGFVESRHHGLVTIVHADGSLAAAVGEPRTVVFPRSVNKPLQTVGLLDAGLADFVADDRFLAIASGSHAGQPRHVDVVLELLHAAGLTPADLDNTPGLPLDEAAAWELLRAGAAADRLHQNCSGKHAAMLATCVAAGWPVAGYVDPQHPLQRALRQTIGTLTETSIDVVGVDGCGAPLFGLPMAGIARGYARLVNSPPGTTTRRVADAMRAHPDLVGGTGRPVTALMSAVPGMLAKDGAEGMFAAAVPDRVAVVVKIWDGAARAAVPVLTAALAAAGVSAPIVDRLASAPVLGHGRVVGQVRPALTLRLQ